MEVKLLINVDQSYLNNLINLSKKCHSIITTIYYNSSYTGLKCIDCDSNLSSIICLSDIIFYLENYDIDKDDNSLISPVKEAAIRICNISENDISISTVFEAILYENGDGIPDEMLEFLFIKE